MSAIRLPVLSPLFPAQSPPSPVRASRSDFFRSALDGVAAPAAAAPATPATIAQPAAILSRAAEDRPQRPGALLDIRV
ncbi:MAG: hypothetical protein ACK4JY_11255 [Brevundimonas sp.]|uniref:hypothetical protein n=1 Tax=Brevundimonas sp. TaxID=1871086 RepID=UPI0039197BAF